MKALDRRTTADLAKLLVFAVVTVLATGVLVVVIGNLSFADSREYRARFVDATGVVKGDDVRVAGVKVGTVQDVEIDEGQHALVTFDVAEQTRVSGSTIATIRYRNLVGQRYLALSDEVGSTERLAEGATIPVQRTRPALDLTVLFNGFKPLFRALSPAEVNKLSYEIVQVFQGEGGTLESLLGHTASITTTLAERDEVIGSLITNLDQVLDHLGDRDQQLSRLIVNFRSLVGGLKDDRRAILDSLDAISELSVQTAGLVDGVHEPLVEDIAQLRRLTGNIERNKGELDRAMQVLPIKLEKIGRTATYGSFFNFYLCHVGGRVRLPGGIAPAVRYHTGSARCDLG